MANNQDKPKATLYRVDGTEENVTPKNGEYFTLDELQGFVGGYIENGYMDDGRVMVLNEEGKFQNLPYNKKATEIYQKYVYPHDIIVGNALVSDPQFIV